MRNRVRMEGVTAGAVSESESRTEGSVWQGDESGAIALFYRLTASVRLVCRAVSVFFRFTAALGASDKANLEQ